MKKLILICLSIMCLLTSAFAQYKHYNDQTKQWKEYPSYEEYIFDESQFIFEGEIIASKEYLATDKKRYTAYKIQIKNVFRGNLKLGTIEILRPDEFLCHRTDFDNGIILLDNPDHSYLPKKGIYFCTPSNYSVNGDVQCVWTKDKGYNANQNDFTTSDNSIQVTPIGILSNFSLPIGYGKILKFRSIAEQYQFLKKFGAGNITIPKEEIQPNKKKDASSSLNDIKKQNEIRYAQNVKNYEKYMQQLQERIAIQQANKSNACKEFLFPNMQMVLRKTKSLKFTILPIL